MPPSSCAAAPSTAPWTASSSSAARAPARCATTHRFRAASIAVNAGGGNDTVHNYGTITGNVDLGSGTNAFNNRAGGIFNSGATVILGAGNALTNAGTLCAGRHRRARDHRCCTGNLVQTGTGTFAVDLNLAGSTDQII